MLRAEEFRDYAELARLGRVTRARMTQIMKLLDLAPDIQEQILFLPPDGPQREKSAPDCQPDRLECATLHVSEDHGPFLRGRRLGLKTAVISLLNSLAAFQLHFMKRGRTLAL